MYVGVHVSLEGTVPCAATEQAWRRQAEGQRAKDRGKGGGRGKGKTPHASATDGRGAEWIVKISPACPFPTPVGLDLQPRGALGMRK